MQKTRGCGKSLFTTGHTDFYRFLFIEDQQFKFDSVLISVICGEFGRISMFLLTINFLIVSKEFFQPDVC